ncbi:hypothetical protein [Rubrivivax rivuli]|uniref:PEP-CTERM sorting domain-containing protein n=1 Tax=Rubrivivax rivuli TaxID=1862385 RepID=A0A437REI0_9BURK|nr:hypothetical protein [Rubrivivax rivuli]RVU45124.1 hypothetical protein EOE66_13285 [Rubrivivax rivuli]
MLAVAARAELVTISGTDFDLTYDTTKLGLFGAPSLAGNSIFFTFSGFVAESLNGQGAVTQNSTISGLVLTARNGFQFGELVLVELGDYKLSGAGSRVDVQGRLRAFDMSAPITTQTVAALELEPGSSLAMANGLLHEWAATARIDGNSAVQPVPSVFGVATNAIQARPRALGVSIENQLTAYTEATSMGLHQAFIEKKFAGVQMLVAPVPLPSTAALAGAGLLAGLGLWLRGRQHRHAKAA